jgi:hypothetical protein
MYSTMNFFIGSLPSAVILPGAEIHSMVAGRVKIALA